MLCIRDYVVGEFLLRLSTRRLFLFAALGTLLFTGLRVLLSTAVMTGGLDRLPALLTWLLISLLALGAISWATIYVGMLVYWFLHDRGAKRGRSWWLPFLFLMPLASVIYYFAVYRPELRPDLPNAASGAHPVPNAQI